MKKMEKHIKSLKSQVFKNAILMVLINTSVDKGLILEPLNRCILCFSIYLFFIFS